MSYNWTSAATEQGRERLRTLVESLNGSDFVIVATSHKQGRRFIRQIFNGEEAFGQSFLQRFEEYHCPFKEFLDPEPPAPVVDDDSVFDYREEDKFLATFGDRLKSLHDSFGGSYDQWYRVARTARDIIKSGKTNDQLMIEFQQFTDWQNKQALKPMTAPVVDAVRGIDG